MPLVLLSELTDEAVEISVTTAPPVNQLNDYPFVADV